MAEGRKGKLPGTRVAALIITAAVVFAVYSPTLLNGFVYDDNVVILKSEWIRDAANLPKIFGSSAWGETEHGGDDSLKFYRPVMTSLFMLGYHISGVKAWGFHLINIIFHTLSALIVFLIAEGMLKPVKHGAASGAPADDVTRRTLAAMSAALLFGLHPIGVEAVAWVSAISELSFSFFFLLSLYLYTRAVKAVSILTLLSLLAFFLATLSKETALMLPATVIAYDLLFRRHAFKERLGAYLAYFAVAGGYLAIRANALKGLPQGATGHEDITTLTFLMNLPVLTGQYLFMLALPLKLSIFHSFEIIYTVVNARFIFALIFFSALAIILAYLYRKERRMVFLAPFMILPLAPALYFPMLGLHFFAERYLYLPSAAFAILLSILIMKSSEHFTSTAKARSKTFIAVSLLVLALYAQGVVRHSLVWHDDLSLWSNAAAKYPESSYSHYNVGAALYNLGKKDEALTSYEKAVELNYYNRNLHYDIALIYIEKRLFGEAITHLEAAIDGGLDHDPHLYINLGNAYAGLGKYLVAEVSYLKALELAPGNTLAAKNLSIIRQRMRIGTGG